MGFAEHHQLTGSVVIVGFVSRVVGTPSLSPTLRLLLMLTRDSSGFGLWQARGPQTRCPPPQAEAGVRTAPTAGDKGWLPGSGDRSGTGRGSTLRLRGPAGSAATRVAGAEAATRAEETGPAGAASSALSSGHSSAGPQGRQPRTQPLGAQLAPRHPAAAQQGASLGRHRGLVFGLPKNFRKVQVRLGPPVEEACVAGPLSLWKQVQSQW